MKKSTLMHYSKEYLADTIIMLEKNIEALNQTIDQQYYNAMKIIDDMNLMNQTYKKFRRGEYVNESNNPVTEQAQGGQNG